MTISSRVRLVGRWAARLAGVLAFLLVAIHAPPVQRAVGRALALAMGGAVHGTATIDRLEYRLWRGEARVTGLRIVTPSFHAEAQSVVVHVATAHSVTIAIEAPALVVTGAEGDARSPGPPVRPAVPRALERVTVRDGRLAWGDGFVLRGVDVRMTRRPVGADLSVAGTLERRDDPVAVGIALRASFVPVASDVLVALSAEGAGARVLARATIASDAGVEASYDVSLASLAETAQALRPFGGPRLPPELSGSVAASGSLRIRGDVATAVGGLKLHDSRLVWRGQSLAAEGALSLLPDGVQIDTLVLRSGRGAVQVSGTLPGRGRDLKLQGRVDEWAVGSLTSVPELSAARLDGTFHLAGREPNGEAEAQLTWAESRAKANVRKIGSTLVIDDLRWDGPGHLRAEGDYDLVSRRLRACLDVDGLDLARIPWARTKAGASGTISAHALLEGPVPDLAGRVEIETHALVVRGRALTDVRLHVQGDRRHAVLSYDRGAGPVPLAEAGIEERRLHAEIDLARLPWETLSSPDGMPALTFKAAGRATLDVPLDRPRGVRYRIDVQELAAQTHEVGATAVLSASGDRDVVHVERLSLKSGDDVLAARGTLALGGPHTLNVDVDGALPLALLRVARPDAAIEGRLTAALHVGGSLARPLVQGEADVEARRGDGVFRAHGKANADGGTRVDVLCENLGLAGDPADPAAPRLTAKASAQIAPREAGTPPEVQGGIEQLAIDLGSRHVTLAERAPFEWKNGRLRLPAARLSGDGQELRVSAELVGQPQLRYSLTAEGAVDLAVLGPVLPKDLELGGVVDVSVAAHGPEKPSFEAEANLREVKLVWHEIGLNLFQMEGRLRLREGALHVDGLQGVNGEGRVRLDGRLDFDEERRPVAADGRVVAEHLPLGWPRGLRSVVDTELDLKGTGGQFSVAGHGEVVNATYAREDDESKAATGPLDDLQKPAGAERSFKERIALDIDLRTLSDIRVNAPRADLAAGGRVKVSGTLEDPALTGFVNVAPSGRLNLGSSSMMLTKGRVTLEGFPDTPALLDFRGNTRVSGVLMEVAVRGRTDALETELSAPDRPDLTQGELASLLVSGRTSGGSGDASGKIVADQVLGALGGRLQKRTGDIVTVDISTDVSFFSQDTEPTPRFNVGRRITGGLSVIYSAALDKAGSRWIVELEPNKRIRLREIAEDDGSFATEVSDRVSFTFTGRPSRIQAEPITKIGEVRIDGALPLPESQVRKWLGDLRTGKRYEAWAAHRSGEKLAQRLAGKGWRTATVDVVPAAPVDGRRDVRVVVTAGPRVRFVWTGDTVRRRWRRDTVKAWNPRLPLDSAVADVAHGLEIRVRARRRHLAARVEPSVEGGDDEKTVTFRVRRGPAGGRVVLDVEGNRQVSTATLRRTLPDLDSREMLPAYEQGGRGLRAALRVAYAEQGFPYAAIGEPKTRIDKERGDLHVSVSVEEGQRAVLREVTLPEAPPARTVPPTTSLRVGDVLRLGTYVKERDALSTWYRHEGYPEARVTAGLTPVEGGVALRFEVEKGPQPRVRSVRVMGADRTRFGVLGRNMVLGPGDVITPLDLARTRERLGRARGLASVDVRTEKVPATPDAKDIVVEVSERPDVEVAYGLRWQTNSPEEESDELQGAASVSFNNLLRMAERVTAFGYVAASHLYYGTSVALPPRGALDTQLSLYVDDDSETEIDGVERLVRAAVVQQSLRAKTVLRERRFADLLRLQWGYAFKHYRFIDTQGALQPLPSPFETNRGLLSLALMGDTRDVINDPHRGFLWSAAAQLASHLVGSDEDYVRLYGQFFFHRAVGKVVLAAGLRAGVVPGTNPALLVEDRFRAGGATTVRGFGQNELGPRSHTDDPIGGQAVVVFNQEVRFPIRGKLKGGLFYDAGNVFARAPEVAIDDLRHDVGAGLRLMLPFGPIRLDWAYVLGARPGEDRSRFSFALGHVF